MAAGLNVGLGCKLYLNAGSYGTPSWVEIPTVEDLDLDLDMTFAEIKARLANVIMNLPAFAQIGLEFGLLGDTSIATWGTLQGAYGNRLIVDFAVADQAIATPGCIYFRGDFYVKKFPLSQKLEAADMGQVACVPAYSTHAFAFVSVGS